MQCRPGLHILDIFTDRDAFEQDGLTPVVMYKLEQRNLSHRGNSEKPIRLVAKINIDTLESDPFFVQYDGDPLNEWA